MFDVTQLEREADLLSRRLGELRKRIEPLEKKYRERLENLIKLVKEVELLLVPQRERRTIEVQYGFDVHYYYYEYKWEPAVVCIADWMEDCEPVSDYAFVVKTKKEIPPEVVIELLRKHGKENEASIIEEIEKLRPIVKFLGESLGQISYLLDALYYSLEDLRYAVENYKDKEAIEREIRKTKETLEFIRKEASQIEETFNVLQKGGWTIECQTVAIENYLKGKEAPLAKYPTRYVPFVKAVENIRDENLKELLLRWWNKKKHEIGKVRYVEVKTETVCEERVRKCYLYSGSIKYELAELADVVDYHKLIEVTVVTKTGETKEYRLAYKGGKLYELSD